MTAWNHINEELPKPGYVIDVLVMRPAIYTGKDNNGFTTWTMYNEFEQIVAWKIPDYAVPFYWRVGPQDGESVTDSDKRRSE